MVDLICTILNWWRERRRDAAARRLVRLLSVHCPMDVQVISSLKWWKDVRDATRKKK